MHEMVGVQKPQSRRRRIGKSICLLSGLAVVITLFGGLVVTVAAMSGVTQPMISYNQYASPVALLSILSFLVGLVMYIIPEGFSEDGAWVMMTGPFAGNN